MKILQTKDNKTYEITEEQAEKIADASLDNSLPGVWVGTDYINFYQITSITDKPSHREEYPALPGTVWDRSGKNGKKLMLKGFKNWLDKNPKASKAAAFYRELERGRASFDKEYLPQYLTDEHSSGYEKAKAAGVV